jgi:hypothetical protein
VELRFVTPWSPFPVKEVSMALLLRIVVFFLLPASFFTLVAGETTDDESDENRSISMQR